MQAGTAMMQLDPSYLCRTCGATPFDEEGTVTACPSGQGDLGWVNDNWCSNCALVIVEEYRHEKLPGHRFHGCGTFEIIKILEEEDSTEFLRRKEGLNSTIREARSIWPHNMACVASKKHNMACALTHGLCYCVTVYRVTST
jgi:hypothetical protein